MTPHLVHDIALEQGHEGVWDGLPDGVRKGGEGSCPTAPGSVGRRGVP